MPNYHHGSQIGVRLEQIPHWWDDDLRSLQLAQRRGVVCGVRTGLLRLHDELGFGIRRGEVLIGESEVRRLALEDLSARASLGS